MAYDSQARHAKKHHADFPALTGAGAEPCREHLAISPPELALKHRLRELRRHRRRRLRPMAEADRQARNHHIHRDARLGPRRSAAMTFGIRHLLPSQSSIAVSERAREPAIRSLGRTTWPG